ncbi:platelet-activating factor acetyltransferase activity protein [Homalodisca vitripennis]|nr:platelet-activating factor acetyltransferase activity protein [Homalodisca vitripennis]
MLTSVEETSSIPAAGFDLRDASTWWSVDSNYIDCGFANSHMYYVSFTRSASEWEEEICTGAECGLELFPRGQHPNPLRERNASVNELVRRKLQGRSRVQTVSCEKGLVGADGTISHHDMPDYLHFSDAGYRKALEPLHDLLLQLLTEGEEERDLTPSE